MRAAVLIGTAALAAAGVAQAGGYGHGAHVGGGYGGPAIGSSAHSGAMSQAKSSSTAFSHAIGAGGVSGRSSFREGGFSSYGHGLDLSQFEGGHGEGYGQGYGYGRADRNRGRGYGYRRGDDHGRYGHYGRRLGYGFADGLGSYGRYGGYGGYGYEDGPYSQGGADYAESYGPEQPYSPNGLGPESPYGEEGYNGGPAVIADDVSGEGAYAYVYNGYAETPDLGSAPMRYQAPYYAQPYGGYGASAAAWTPSQPCGC